MMEKLQQTHGECESFDGIQKEKSRCELVQHTEVQSGAGVVSDSVLYEENSPGTDLLLLEAFRSGDFELYERLCGHPYRITGKVVHGKALGRTVGMPTANLEISKGQQIPPQGVYAVIGHVAGETRFGLANIGTRPSVDDSKEITLEVFLSDFDKNIYGEQFTVELLKYLRKTKKFHDLSEVKKQVQKDLKEAKRFWDQRSLACFKRKQ